MERCANTEALNRYLDQQDKAEEAMEYFASCVQEELGALEELDSYYKKGCKLLNEDLQEELYEILESEAEALQDRIMDMARNHSNEYGYEFTEEAHSLIKENKGELL